jgi:hypothetical protein
MTRQEILELQARDIAEAISHNVFKNNKLRAMFEELDGREAIFDGWERLILRMLKQFDAADLEELRRLKTERDRLDGELSEVLSTSTRRIGEIAMLRDQAKRLREALGKERDMRVAYDKSRAPRSGDFADECVPLLHRLCDATRERWTACLVMWAAEMLNTGAAADVALRELVEVKERKVM